MKAFVWNIIIERCTLRFERMAVGEATIRSMLLYVLQNHHFKMWSTVVQKFFLVLREKNPSCSEKSFDLKYYSLLLLLFVLAYEKFKAE